jgi:hypothetical protein
MCAQPAAKSPADSSDTSLTRYRPSVSLAALFSGNPLCYEELRFSMTEANLNRSHPTLRPMFRLLIVVCFLASTALLNSCASLVKYKDDSIPQPLTPVAEADFDALLVQLKPFTELDSMRATRISMKFVDSAASERYRGAADATIVLKRPGNIRLIIQVPVARTKLAEMVSDSKHFKVAIYYDKYKRFLLGTSNADYSRWREKLEGSKEAQQSGFINARPFHFTDALLVRPLQIGKAGFIYNVQEELSEEPDTRPGAKKNARVIRSFYIVSEMEITDTTKNIGVLKRRFWFDRNSQLQLKRQQVFDDKGKLITDARYSNYLKFTPDSQVLRPSVIEVRRPYDKYSAELNLLAESTEFNLEDLPATAFVLENDQNLPETDLDKQP